MRRFLVRALLLPSLVACASGQSPRAAPGAAEAEDGSAESIDTQRAPFIQGCLENARSPEYCSCAFEQFRIVFRDAKLEEPLAEDDPRLKTLHKKTVDACGAMVDEDEVHASFLDGCIEGEPRKRAYCECAWPALRSHLSVREFLGDTETLRFFAAKKHMTTACKGKFPADLARSDFMEGCQGEDGSDQAMCACLWKKVSARFGAEEIVAGTADLSAVPELSECK